MNRAVGKVDLHRPTYSHMIALNGKPKKATPDVIPCGKSLYKNGTGMNAAITGVEWIRGQADAIVDPFCGRGTIPAVADCLGIKSVGIDIDAEQCRYAELLSVDVKKIC